VGVFAWTGEHKEFPEVGLRCLVLAAERGVRGAAAAAAHAYATASGVGAALRGADLTQAVKWYKKALDGDVGTEEEETEVEVQLPPVPTLC
jgi:TPR repeat protein